MPGFDGIVGREFWVGSGIGLDGLVASIDEVGDHFYSSKEDHASEEVFDRSHLFLTPVFGFFCSSATADSVASDLASELSDFSDDFVLGSDLSSTMRAPMGFGPWASSWTVPAVDGMSSFEHLFGLLLRSSFEVGCEGRTVLFDADGAELHLHRSRWHDGSEKSNRVGPSGHGIAGDLEVQSRQDRDDQLKVLLKNITSDRGTKSRSRDNRLITSEIMGTYEKVPKINSRARTLRDPSRELWHMRGGT